MKKNIFDPQMILNHLAKNDNDKLQIFLTNSPTNYNFNLKTLFLSYKDITKIENN